MTWATIWLSATVPFKDKEVNRAWDRKRNAGSPTRRFANSIGRYKRALRARIALKEERIKELEENLYVPKV